MSRFVAYVGSSSAVEQTFSQCRSQFGHLRNLSVLGIQRVLVLAGTKSQSQEADESLYARARLIWAENFAAPRLPKTMTCLNPWATRAKAARALNDHTEAALRRQREAGLCKLRTQPLAMASASVAAAAQRSWDPKQAKELKRQQLLQRDRLLDAADLGVAEVDPYDLRSFRVKSKETHKRYMERHAKLAQGRSPHEIEIKPGMPTWIDDRDWCPSMRRAFFNRRAVRVADVSQAQVFVVRDVAAPPRLVSLVASLIGGLIVSTTFFADPPGPAISYHRALRLDRRVWISPACQRASPLTIKVITQLVARARESSQGTRWHLIDEAGFFAQAARRQQRRRRGTSELVALVATREVLEPAAAQQHSLTLSRFASRCKRVLSTSDGFTAGVH